MLEERENCQHAYIVSLNTSSYLIFFGRFLSSGGLYSIVSPTTNTTTKSALRTFFTAPSFHLSHIILAKCGDKLSISLVYYTISIQSPTHIPIFIL